MPCSDGGPCEDRKSDRDVRLDVATHLLCAALKLVPSKLMTQDMKEWAAEHQRVDERVARYRALCDEYAREQRKEKARHLRAMADAADSGADVDQEEERHDQADLALFDKWRKKVDKECPSQPREEYERTQRVIDIIHTRIYGRQ